LTDPSLSFPDQPRVELDRRIADLVTAANDVLAAQGRLRELLRANHAITAQLELDSVLRTIVDSARALSRAESAALGVLDGRGGFEQVVHAGTDLSDVPPRPRSPLGEVAGSTGQGDDGSLGTNLLEVPVLVHGEIYANLILTNRPSDAFSDEDEQLVRSLAATAGFALEHARLYRETQRREEFAAASAAVTSALLGENADSALSLVADRVRTLLEADSVFVALLDDDGERLKVAAVQGADPNSRRDTEVPLAGSLVERMLRQSEPNRIDEATVRAWGIPSTQPYGPVLALPLDAADRLHGAIIVTRAPGGRSFSEADLAVAGDFAGRTSVALELHRARGDQQRMLLFEDRGRIARDLHDRVIQQLFATGMQLQAVHGTLPEGRNADRIDASITSLDAAIAQIRRIIFTLSSPERAGAAYSGRHRLLDLVAELASSLSVDPGITFSGPVDALLDADLTDDVLAVVSEGVTNAVKHGGAVDIDVRIAASPSGITVTITSDGRPLKAPGRRSGLANLEERAVRRGGGMRLQGQRDRTVLDWSVPPRHARQSPP
jgi:signal transduction histidine kinase